MKSFQIHVPQNVLDAIRARVRDYDWHEMPRGEGLEGSWAYGANLDFMKALCAYWVDGYDWRKCGRRAECVPAIHRARRGHRSAFLS